MQQYAHLNFFESIISYRRICFLGSLSHRRFQRQDLQL